MVLCIKLSLYITPNYILVALLFRVRTTLRCSVYWPLRKITSWRRDVPKNIVLVCQRFYRYFGWFQWIFASTFYAFSSLISILILYKPVPKVYVLIISTISKNEQNNENVRCSFTFNAIDFCISVVIQNFVIHKTRSI